MVKTDRMLRKKEYDRQYHITNKEKLNKKALEYHYKHRDKRLEYSKTWRETNEDKIKLYNENHITVRREYEKNYRETHKEGRKQYGKEYNQRPEVKEQNKRRFKNNPEKILSIHRRHFEKYGSVFNLNGQTYKRALQAWGKVIKARDAYTCQDCGTEENLHAHHIKSKKEYPKLSLHVDNGKTVCVDCHYEYTWGDKS